MKDYSIAVIIPAYNAELFIGEALDSVAGQSRRPDQIIVVDDGSTDRTVDCIRKWEQQYHGELHVLQQDNRGVSAARNAGIRYAKTDLIALLDADDLFFPFHLELLERAFKNNPHILLSFGDALYFDSERIIKGSVFAGTRIEGVEYDEQADGLRLLRGPVYSSLLWGNYIAPSASLLLKSAGEKIGLFDEDIKSAEDRDLFLRLSRIGSFAYFPVVVARKRVHENNATHRRHMSQFNRYQLMVLQKMIDNAEELKLSAAEEEQTHAALGQQVWSMLYAESQGGLGPYFETFMYLIRRRQISTVFNPKHFLRAVISHYRAAKNKTPVK
ncbi:MAG TPA: glycosyltransferase [Candidatus Binatia bacterium]|jgi:glycosyltransferase involved in cell wall biosynthesis